MHAGHWTAGWCWIRLLARIRRPYRHQRPLPTAIYKMRTCSLWKATISGTTYQVIYSVPVCVVIMPSSPIREHNQHFAGLDVISMDPPRTHVSLLCSRSCDLVTLQAAELQHVQGLSHYPTKRKTSTRTWCKSSNQTAPFLQRCPTYSHT